MITADIKGTKVVLKLAEGSQTVTDCNIGATNEQLYALATAVAKLEKEELEGVTKVVETNLISE